MNCVFAFLLFTTTAFLLSPVVDGGAAVAPFVCPALCEGILRGGKAAAKAAAITASIASPLLDILDTVLDTIEATLNAIGSAECTAVCVAAIGRITPSCFDEETISTVLENGKLQDVPLRVIGENSVVKCLNEDDVTSLSFTKIKRMQIIEGHFDFVQLDFEDKVTSLNVTTPHIMIVHSKDKGFMAKAAKDVKVGDQMLSSKTGTVLRVSKISSFHKSRKIHVETESGTLVANGLYVSGVCEYNPRIQNTTSQSRQELHLLNEFLHTYRKRHGYFQMNVNWR